MPFFLGIDVGSGFCKAVVCESGVARSQAVLPSGGDYRGTARKAAEEALGRLHLSLDDIAYSVSTGYGSAMADFARDSVTDMACQAYALHHLFPAVRTVIDVGAQFSRALRVNEEGRLVQFVMNEKCAGGSGKFLQVAARILKIGLEELGGLSMTATKPVDFTTSCAVFAESEAVSRIAEGAAPADILAGIHRAMASKIVTLAVRVGLVPDCAVTGGGARDAGLVKAIEAELGAGVMVARDPQVTAALGAALLAAERARQ
jgi:(R)-2-hydroxyacyl-CoA dehydratese activating ATPase